MEGIVERLVNEKNKAYERRRDFDKLPWLPIPCTDPERKRVKLYECDRDGYMLKAVMHMEGCDPKKILRLNIDNNFETRKQWETDELMGIEQVQQLKLHKINVVRYWINIPVVKNREFLGIQCYFPNKKRQSHMLIFQSVLYDEYFPCDETKYVRGTCVSLMKINKNSLVTIYTHVHPNGWIPDMMIPIWKEKLRDRMLLYEKVIKEDFDTIYAPWSCAKCGQEWGVNEEKCRKCHYEK